MNVQVGNDRRGSGTYSRISYHEAIEFKELFTEPAWVSVSFNATGMSTVKYGSEETNPNVSLIGVDENYLAVSGYEMEKRKKFQSG